MTIQTVAIVFNVLVLSLQCNSLMDKKTIMMDRMIKCPGYNNLTILYDKISFNHVKTYFSVNMRMTVKESTTSGLRVKIVMNRCKSKEALDTCEPYPDISFSNLCFVINTKMPPFRASVERFEPALICPIKKGVYELKNGSIDESSLSVFPFENYYFKIHTYLIDKIDNELKIVACMYVEGRLINL